MSIIEVEVKIPERIKVMKIFKADNKKSFEVMIYEIKILATNIFNKWLEAEMNLFLSKTDPPTNKYNGFYKRELAIK